jgi:TRAP-type C4-dicarboxylate transport system substrate-binding protein
MKRITIPALFVFCICSLFTVTASAKTQFTYANFFPPTHIQSQLAESWCKEVEKGLAEKLPLIIFLPAL